MATHFVDSILDSNHRAHHGSDMHLTEMWPQAPLLEGFGPLEVEMPDLDNMHRLFSSACSSSRRSRSLCRFIQLAALDTDVRARKYPLMWTSRPITYACTYLHRRGAGYHFEIYVSTAIPLIITLPCTRSFTFGHLYL